MGKGGGAIRGQRQKIETENRAGRDRKEEREE